MIMALVVYNKWRMLFMQGYLLLVFAPTYSLQWPVKPASSDAVICLMRRDMVDPVMTPWHDEVELLNKVWRVVVRELGIPARQSPT